MASPYPNDLDVTIVSAKHLKNVNWRNGHLLPYVVVYLDSDRQLATHSDDSSTKEHVWNERFSLPINRPVEESTLTIEIFHSKVSETLKPLVGSVQLPLAQLVELNESFNTVRTLKLIRPSGRPQGKVRVKLAIKERPSPPPPPHPAQHQDYYNTYQSSYYYSPASASAPVPARPPMTASQSRDYRDFSPSAYVYPDQVYNSCYYPPVRGMDNQTSSYNLPGGPSAPVYLPSSDDHHSRPTPPTMTHGSHYGAPSGPSAPLDFSPYDYKQLPKDSGDPSLVDDDITTAKVESNFASKEADSHGGDYRRN